MCTLDFLHRHLKGKQVISNLVNAFSEKWTKSAKYLKIWAKIYKIWKYFEKGQGRCAIICMQETARIIPIPIERIKTKAELDKAKCQQTNPIPRTMIVKKIYQVYT